MKNVLVFLAEGFEEIEAVTIVDLLRRANINCKTISITEKREVMGAHGVPFIADMLFDENVYGSNRACVAWRYAWNN